ncbi:RimK/LysX family protein [Polaribacter cellanae]|uniref:ATP-dependent zinc protease n=1 Tax=Polaribacter cellanae TaxID=2818493 RepID=A0A975H791_9FLAO|nr:RimK/LysX family protein [Polaribacter cellanae]QTE23266.1 ATP-dependent zinc protease [Polaribacter cellanae]
MKAIFKILILIIFIFKFTISFSQKNKDKEIIGQKVTIKIKGTKTKGAKTKAAKIKFRARVDTGAKTTSINAKNIKKKGKYVKFSIVNRKGKKISITKKIIDERVVFNAEKKEKRIFVYLTLVYKKTSRKVLVDLNDRSTSTYKVLLGRNWLNGKYIVDVSLK